MCNPQLPTTHLNNTGPFKYDQARALLYLFRQKREQLCGIGARLRAATARERKTRNEQREKNRITEARHLPQLQGDANRCVFYLKLANPNVLRT